MKLLLALLLFTLPALGQEIVNKADLIVITSALPDVDLYKTAGQLLIKDGYTISKSDRDFLQLQTDAKLIKGSNANPRLQVTVTDGKVKIIGWLGPLPTALQQQVYYPIRAANRGMNKSPLKLTFIEMDKYARAVSEAVNGTIAYKIEQ